MHKLAQALLTIAGEAPLYARFLAGADAVGLAEQVILKLQQETNACRDLSGAMVYDER